jgi:hypothetical protein
MLPFLGRPATVTPEVATFAGGCFWGVEHIFLKHYPPSQNKGILKTAVGYIGGNTNDPTYRKVSSGTTNHAEALRIEFDPTIVSYAELVGECLILAFCCSEVGCEALTSDCGLRVLLPYARPYDSQQARA